VALSLSNEDNIITMHFHKIMLLTLLKIWTEISSKDFVYTTLNLVSFSWKTLEFFNTLNSI